MGTVSLERQSTEASSELFLGSTGTAQDVVHATKSGGTHVQLCTDNGVTIVATDYGEGDHTDFILSPSAFVKLARTNMASELVAYGVVDIEYRRVPIHASIQDTTSCSRSMSIAGSPTTLPSSSCTSQARGT